MTETLATAASLLLTRGPDQRLALDEAAVVHLGHVIEACACLEHADAFEAEAASLLGLAHVLRTEHDAPDAAEALVAALRASPTAVRILRLEEAAQPAAEPHHRALAEVTGRGVPARRAPTGREAAPAGSFKPPRPARLR